MRERLDLLHPARDDLVVDVLHDHGDAVERDELRDPRAHRPGPDDRDLSRPARGDVARDPGRRLAGALALEEEFDQVARGGREDDRGELVALGGEPGRARCLGNPASMARSAAGRAG